MSTLGLLIHDVARLLKGEFERRASGSRLTLQQWRVLAKLAKSDGMTQRALGLAVEASPMTVSDVLDRLEKEGLVRREADPADSRAKLVWITPEADPIVAEMRRVADEVYDAAMAGLGASDRRAVINGLERIAANLAGPRNDKRDETS